MKRRQQFLVLLALAYTMLAGCAVTPMVQEVQPIDGDLSRYSVLEVVVEAPVPIQKLHGYAITASELQREFIANVSASGKFRTVSPIVRDPKSLGARLIINNFNYVSGATRGLTGVLGGRAVLNVALTLTDNETNKPVGMIVAGDRSNYAQGVFGAVTSTQITAVAKELATKLTGQ